MEEIKSLQDAWEGDLVEWHGKTYRVISAATDYKGSNKLMRVVNSNPLFCFTRVKTIYA